MTISDNLDTMPLQEVEALLELKRLVEAGHVELRFG